MKKAKWIEFIKTENSYIIGLGFGKFKPKIIYEFGKEQFEDFVKTLLKAIEES